MQWLGELHPLIVHTPIALLIFSAFFAIVGRLYDRDWLVKASVVLLVFGFLGAFAAERSGDITHEIAEHQQGVPERMIDEHSDAADWVLRVSGAAIVAIALAARLKGGAKRVVAALALILQIMAAVAVGRTGFLGGRLVYEHGAHVKLNGALVHDPAGGNAAPAAERGHDHD